MSIFERIKTAIFGHGAASASTPAKAPPATPPPVFSTPAAPAPPAPTKVVDIEQVMEGYAAKNPAKLNWRTSIVDLLKLLDIDSSLENRKALANELGYTGSSDSMTMNMWLHKQVLRKLQENGGKVPAGLAN